MVVQGPKLSHPSQRLSPVIIKILVAGSLISILLLLIVLVVVLIRRWRGLRMPSTPSLPLQSPPDISPRGAFPQNPFRDLEKGVEPPLSTAQPAPDDDPFADNVMRDERWAAGELRNQGSVVRQND